MGRIATEVRVSESVTKTSSYGYNQDGSVRSVTYPSTHVLNYTYNGAARATQVVDPAGPINYVTSATYTARGELSTSTNGFVSGSFGGITTANTYNSRLQPVLMSASSPTASVLSLCYDFHSHASINLPPCSFAAATGGDNGNVYQIVNNRDGNRTQNFAYDMLNRITQGNSSGPNWGETFTIDAWGNLTNRGQVTGKTNYELLNAAPASNQNQLPGFTYDAAGNMTQNGSAAYTYNAEGRLKTAGGATYTYDGDGQRIQKAAPAVTLYWYGATGSVLDETLSAGALVSEYVFFNGKRIARRDADNSVKYYFADNLGSASVITNATGAMPPLEESDYYPYGGEMPITNTDPNHYKFTGKERDSESNLDNFGARYFASSLGRFMTPDWADRPTTVPYATFGDPQSLNLYTYVENAPLNRVDADGHYCVMAGLAFWCSADDPQQEETKKGNNKKTQQEVRETIATNAEASSGSTDYSFYKKKDNFACNTNKCNKYVHDIAQSGGAEPLVKGADGKMRPPTAGELASKNLKIGHWAVVDKPQRGDIAAYKLTGGHGQYTGHTGIVTSVEANGFVHAMAAHAEIVGPDDKFNSTPTRAVTYRRYEGDE